MQNIWKRLPGSQSAFPYSPFPQIKGRKWNKKTFFFKKKRKCFAFLHFQVPKYRIVICNILLHRAALAETIIESQNNINQSSQALYYAIKHQDKTVFQIIYE